MRGTIFPPLVIWSKVLYLCNTQAEGGDWGGAHIQAPLGVNVGCDTGVLLALGMGGALAPSIFFFCIGTQCAAAGTLPHPVSQRARFPAIHNRHYARIGQKGSQNTKKVREQVSSYLISIDWLQYYCHSHCDHIPEQGQYYVGKHRDERGVFRNYEVRPTDKHSHVYVYNFAVVWRNMEVAYIGMVPRTPILHPSSASVKIANHVLYKPDWAHYVTDVCSAFDLEPLSITRMDLCYDCTTFVNDYKPNKFIQDYISSSLDDTGYCIIRARSNKYFTVCSKIAKREDEQNPKRITGFYTRNEYLRWGTRDSGTCVYLYNKSLELRQSGEKEYIKDAWKKAGLVSTGNEVVYRVEISVKAKSMQCERSDTPKNIKNLTVRDISALSLDDINSQAKLEDVFFSYADHYFAFRVAQGQHYIKDMLVLRLLDRDGQPSLRPRCLSRSWSIGNSERRAAATIRKFVREYPDMPISWRTDFGHACDALDKIAETKLAAHIQIVDDEVLRFCEDVFATTDPEEKIVPTWAILTKQARATRTQKDHLLQLHRSALRAHALGPISDSVRRCRFDGERWRGPLPFDPYEPREARLYSPAHYEAMYGDIPRIFYEEPRNLRIKNHVS